MSDVFQWLASGHGFKSQVMSATGRPFQLDHCYSLRDFNQTLKDSIDYDILRNKTTLLLRFILWTFMIIWSTCKNVSCTLVHGNINPILGYHDGFGLYVTQDLNHVNITSLTSEMNFWFGSEMHGNREHGLWSEFVYFNYWNIIQYCIVFDAV